MIRLEETGRPVNLGDWLTMTVDAAREAQGYFSIKPLHEKRSSAALIEEEVARNVNELCMGWNIVSSYSKKHMKNLMKYNIHRLRMKL